LNEENSSKANSDGEEFQTAFEEESRRFNNDYFQIIPECTDAREEIKQEEKEYEPDFEEIEEEILCADEEEKEFSCKRIGRCKEK
jgi:hypothetical protein